MKVVMLGNDTEEEVKKRIQIVASSGNLSRANGTVTEVIEKNSDYDSNLKLARAVVGYGHRSISEHDYLNFALEDVTPIVEQILISYRLTSFTIKSRRNVDFRNVGFYVPDFRDKDGNILLCNDKLKARYIKYMKKLFNKYGDWVDEELPIEDCRYILPYCYYSNIIMGCDANELLRMTSDMLYGNISNITEVHELGLLFKNIIEEKVPYLVRALNNEENKECYHDNIDYLDIERNKYKLLKEVNMTNYTKDADNIVLRNIISSRYQVSYKGSDKILKNLKSKDSDIESKIFKSLLKNKSQRELEQVIFSYEIPISLAVLTHITRHRMHSLLIPEFVPIWNLNNYIIPDSIGSNHLDEYKKIFKDNNKEMLYFKKCGVRDEDLVYFYLSGNALNISTTMNGRTLEWISRMRCCNKAQWEIRRIANKMVSDAKSVAPLIGSLLGPTCKVEGYCPEGKDSCKNRGVVVIKKDKN